MKFSPRARGDFLAWGPFLRFYVFLNKMVTNGPRNMKFGTNVVCTIKNKTSASCRGAPQDRHVSWSSYIYDSHAFRWLDDCVQNSLSLFLSLSLSLLFSRYGRLFYFFLFLIVQTTFVPNFMFLGLFFTILLRKT